MSTHAHIALSLIKSLKTGLIMLSENKTNYFFHYSFSTSPLKYLVAYKLQSNISALKQL